MTATTKEDSAWNRLWGKISGQPAVPDKMPPVGRHLSRRVVKYDDGRVLLVMRVTGMPFESVNRRVIRNRFDALNSTFAALAMDKGNRLSITTTLMRRRLTMEHNYAFKSSFAKQFAARYLERFRKGDYYENSFYLSFLLKVEDFEEGVTELEDLAVSMMKALSAYDPECLETYENDGVLFSEVHEFIGELVNGVRMRIPVSEDPGYQTIPGSWLHWGYDTLEIDAPGERKYAVCYDLNVFPRCKAGQLDPMLTLPAEFTITQTFGCTGSYDARKVIEDQKNKLESVGDKAEHEIKELEKAQGYIQSRELAFGEYHAALVVYAANEERARVQGEYVASASLNSCGMRWVKATRSARFTYFSQVPGGKVKPRPMFKSTRSLAASFSMHNYSTGKATGNPIGDGTAVMPLQTVSKGLYNMNFHASRKDQNNTGEMFPGHATLLGATGTGKTTVQTALLSFLERFDPGIFALDVDHGMEIWIEQLGGKYYSLNAGEPTGLAPFELPDTPRNRDFLYDLVGVLGRDYDDKGNPVLMAKEVGQIKDAVDTVYGIDDVSQRTLSRLLESIPEDDGNGLHSRLSMWCHATNGRFAWVLDNAPTGSLDITNERRIGFDVTAFLKKDYPPTEPVLAYLLHLKDLVQQNVGLLATIVEEFWLPLKYTMTREMILKVLKTGRKAGEFMVLVSQSPEEAIASEIWPAIRDQCVTKVYLPNPNAEWENYRRCNLTEREFAELQKLDAESRTFLIKQGNQSVFAMLDLYGFDEDIAVLSGSRENVALWRPVIAECRARAEQELANERRAEVIWERRQAAIEEANALYQRLRKAKQAESQAKKNAVLH